MTLKCYQRTAVSEFLGDSIVYRGLEPADRRLSGLAALQSSLGLRPGRVPRKNEADYARVVVSILQQARRLDAPRAALQRLIFVGDTRLSDGTAFANICQVGGWPGIAFIGSENSQPAGFELLPQEKGGLYLSNRWAGLAEFDRHCAGHGFPVDENTVIVVDLDKTTLGARGRNAQVIDAADPRENLTPRELDVLRLLALGRANKEIAADLGITEETVKTHVGHLLAKLQVENRAQAIVQALKRRLVSLDDLE